MSGAKELDLSFTEVFQQNAPFVWRVLRRLGVAESDVEDVCQDVFVVVHRRLADFEGRSSIRTWIYGICIRSTSDYRNRAHRRRERVTDQPPEQVWQADQSREIERHQARALLDAALDTLDEDRRAVFVLYEIEDLPMSAVAQALEIPLQTAYSRLYSARKVIRKAVERSVRGGQP